MQQSVVSIHQSWQYIHFNTNATVSRLNHGNHYVYTSQYQCTCTSIEMRFDQLQKYLLQEITLFGKTLVNLAFILAMTTQASTYM